MTNIKKLIDNTIVVGNFNISLTAMDRTSKQKINKERRAVNDILDQMDLIDIFRVFHPKTTEYIFFASSHRTVSRIDHILGNKSVINQHKKITVIPYIFSDHNALKLKVDCKKKILKDHRYMEVKEHPT